MHLYERSIHVRAPLAQIFEFHLNPHNARLISPIWVEVVSVEAPPEPIVGARITVDSKFYGMAQHWEVEWREIQPPVGSPAEAWMIDEALKAPFPFWRHRHHFRENAGMVELTDSVEYEVPMGWLGNAFHYILRRELEVLFFARQKRTKEILEAAQVPDRAQTAINAATFRDLGSS